MTQTILTSKIIAKEALLVLENELVMANLIHRDYSPEFQQKVGATVFVRKPATFAASAFSTTVAAQEVVESSVAIILDKFYDISASITSADLTLQIADFSEQILQPMMKAHAQNVDYQIWGVVYDDVAGHTTISSTPAISDLANLMAQLDIQKAPVTERRVALSPPAQAKYAALDAVLHADKRGTSLTIDEYRIGRILGADYYMTQNVPIWSSYIVTDAVVDLKGAMVAGATAATIDGLTTTDSFDAGDVFKVVGSNKGYMIVTGGTGATIATIVFTPALDVGVADNAVVTFQKTHRTNMAFHKNAFALVTAPLAPYLGGVDCSVANYKGISCRVAFQGDLSDKTNKMSVDMLFGVKTLDKELAARLVDTNAGY